MTKFIQRYQRTCEPPPETPEGYELAFKDVLDCGGVKWWFKREIK